MPLYCLYIIDDVEYVEAKSVEDAMQKSNYSLSDIEEIQEYQLQRVFQPHVTFTEKFKPKGTNK